MTEHKQIGVAVVGSGRIGAMRAQLAAAHPAVRFLAVSDADPVRARALAEKTGAHVSSGDNLEVISHPEVDAVIVSTSEHEHAEPVLRTAGAVLVPGARAPKVVTEEMVQAIADQAGIAVLNARLYTESQRQARVMTALADESGTMIPGGNADKNRKVSH